MYVFIHTSLWHYIDHINCLELLFRVQTWSIYLFCSRIKSYNYLRAALCKS